MRTPSFMRLTALALIFSAGFFGRADAFEYRQIDDWAVSCNNGYGCTISFNPPAGQSGRADIAAIQWHRTIDSNAPLTLSLPSPPGFAEKGDAKGEFSISVDGADVFSVRVSQIVRNNASGTLGVSQPGEMIRLFRRMADGKQATVSYSGGLGEFSASIMLTGLLDSARFIDVYQGREGRSDAIVAPGNITPPEKANVWSIDLYEELPQSILRNLSDENSFCYTDEAHLEQADAFGFKGKSTTIIVLPCGASGAYNQPYQIYVGRDQDFHRSEFPNFGTDGITVLDTVYNVNFDLKNMKLSSTYLGRGLGDCGLAHYWRIDPEASGNPLVLTHERAKNACDGNDAGAENWPLIWQAKDLPVLKTDSQ
ncbi:DUF1176 domain-containing protein [Martelella mediterranea]|uniref:Uncharacterized protein DUF1176 n=1 Tax=Martelella mediterranea TaxID=293089 RepID=A0A4R3P2Q1_9HYPH|nr:DUF1176 domain-containing protein [Martelella mediterranea]TCT44988.1 uncharacterized protein DUF1176 [Martelella mediterranea]